MVFSLAKVNHFKIMCSSYKCIKKKNKQTNKQNNTTYTQKKYYTVSENIRFKRGTSPFWHVYFSHPHQLSDLATYVFSSSRYCFLHLCVRYIYRHILCDFTLTCLRLLLIFSPGAKIRYVALGIRLLWKYEYEKKKIKKIKIDMT